jgi:membrane protein implicated in regulation of membrane protease activity
MKSSTILSVFFLGLLAAAVFTKFVVLPFMPWQVGLIMVPIMLIAAFWIIRIVSDPTDSDA